MRSGAVHFLDMRRVGEHERAEVTGGAGRPDAALVPLRHEIRQTAGVVDVGVAQDDAVDLIDGERESHVLVAILATPSLEEATIEQHRARADAEDMARACHFLGGAGELDLHGFGPDCERRSVIITCREDIVNLTMFPSA